MRISDWSSDVCSSDLKLHYFISSFYSRHRMMRTLFSSSRRNQTAFHRATQRVMNVTAASPFYTEEHVSFRQQVRRFVEREIAPNIEQDRKSIRLNSSH